MTRTVLTPDDLRPWLAEQFGSDRRLTSVDRLSGGSKKGVYRLGLDDRATVILYVWSRDENYWPPSRVVPDDPFTDASGADLFEVSHAALSVAGVPVPRLLALDRGRRHLDAELAVVEDAGSLRLDAVMERDPSAAATALSVLSDALRQMHTTLGPRYGKLAAIARGEAPQTRPAEDVIVERALGHLDAAAARDVRLAGAHDRIAAHVRHLRGAVTARRIYGLVHGELGPDHVLVTPAGEPVVIDFEGLAYFDIEWDHAWLQLRFGDTYPALRPVELDHDRLELYRYAQTLSLVEGPLRLADTGFPDRQWLLDLAEWNIVKAITATGR